MEVWNFRAVTGVLVGYCIDRFNLSLMAELLIGSPIVLSFTYLYWNLEKREIKKKENIW
ncbi:hypothetical protein [Pseudalkalibacillus salsuginis]|uniref:hypothetical protein n=1 Tax=Pseudalkalibacillus salsuginis TaxID=2910972 RepID=UPI001F166052|nr:hypothetical protein [Pseudalkalibacillus salsuginis]MCF6411586.1 hypothetical protein [Pseudalkalibacillus salsuginis]